MFSSQEIPLAPADPDQEAELLEREAAGVDFRCPCCGHGWKGHPRPPLKGKLAALSAKWRSQVPKLDAKKKATA
jgi:hypothetical protein